MHKIRFAVFLLAVLCLLPLKAEAQGAAPAMFGINEVVIEYAHFDDPKAADSCGLTREQLSALLSDAFKGTNVPVKSALEAKPRSQGLSRLELIPRIYSYSGEDLNCVSWVSLSAENYTDALIPPVSTLRNVTIVYWQQMTRVTTGQSSHAEKVGDVLQQMVKQFAQQYHVDQPSSSTK